MPCASSWNGGSGRGTGPPRDRGHRAQLGLERLQEGGGSRGQAGLLRCWVAVSHRGPGASGRIRHCPLLRQWCGSEMVSKVRKGLSTESTSLPSCQPLENVMPVEMHSCSPSLMSVPFKFTASPAGPGSPVRNPLALSLRGGFPGPGFQELPAPRSPRAPSAGRTASPSSLAHWVPGPRQERGRRWSGSATAQQVHTGCP